MIQGPPGIFGATSMGTWGLLPGPFPPLVKRALPEALHVAKDCCVYPSGAGSVAPLSAVDLWSWLLGIHGSPWKSVVVRHFLLLWQFLEARPDLLEY
jgi:hypothetical protein